MSIAIIQYLLITDASGRALRRHQNFSFDQSDGGYTFEAFNVSSLISKVSSGSESLNIELLPNLVNFELVETGLRQYYIARVQQFQSLANAWPGNKTLLAEFTGEFQSASFTESSVTLTIGSNLDSVERQVPPRNYTTTLTGTPPKL